MFSHPQIMADFLTVETVKSPSYSNPFSCYFYPLEKEKSQNDFSDKIRGPAVNLSASWFVYAMRLEVCS
jgi:hypothetical protein